MRKNEMLTFQINPRWRARIEGDEDDIADLERLLEGSATARDSFLIRRLEGIIPILITTRWDELVDHAAVRGAAEAALRLFNGALNIHDVANLLSIGVIYEVQPDGTGNQTLTKEFRIKVKKAPANKPTPQKFAKTIALSQRHNWLASALTNMAGPVDWFAAFRVVEAIEAHLGGEKAMMRSKLINGAELKRVKRMANSFRHLQDGTHLPPVPPVSLDEAGRTLRQALEILIATFV